jgi:hypothetical protein
MPQKITSLPKLNLDENSNVNRTAQLTNLTHNGQQMVFLAPNNEPAFLCTSATDQKRLKSYLRQNRPMKVRIASIDEDGNKHVILNDNTCGAVTIKIYDKTPRLFISSPSKSLFNVNSEHSSTIKPRSASPFENSAQEPQQTLRHFFTL